MEDGQPKKAVRKIRVKAGEQTSVNLTAAEPVVKADPKPAPNWTRLAAFNITPVASWRTV